MSKLFLCQKLLKAAISVMNRHIIFEFNVKCWIGFMRKIKKDLKHKKSKNEQRKQKHVMKNLSKISRKFREKLVIYKFSHIFRINEKKYMLKNCVRNHKYK